MADDRDWPAVFDTTFRTVADTVQRTVFRAVYGDEYPEEVDPYSFVSRSELRRLGEELRVGPGDVLGDLGCGRGGPGLWLAATTGADLVGVDISEVALAAATARAGAAGLARRARYRLGSFAGTGLPDGALDAAVSIDALTFAPDKPAALVEFARILRPGGRLAILTGDYHRQPTGRPPQVDDHRPLLAAAGFAVDSYVDTDDWRRRLAGVADGLLAAAAEVAEESGRDLSEVRADLELMRRTVDDMSRRVLVIADRLPPPDR